MDLELKENFSINGHTYEVTIDLFDNLIHVHCLEREYSFCENYPLKEYLKYGQSMAQFIEEKIEAEK